MPAEIRIAGMYEKIDPLADVFAIDTTSKSGIWSDLSPFKLGPCKVDSYPPALLMENAWQFSKLYRCHAEVLGVNHPSGKLFVHTMEHIQWRLKGFADPIPRRYPMGKGAKPLCSLWHGEHLGYIDARKRIYVPLYAKAVVKTEGFRRLRRMYKNRGLLVLRDYDGYDHGEDSLTDVLHNQKKKMGHAFVLKMLLTEDPALDFCNL